MTQDGELTRLPIASNDLRHYAGHSGLSGKILPSGLEPDRFIESQILPMEENILNLLGDQIHAYQEKYCERPKELAAFLEALRPSVILNVDLVVMVNYKDGIIYNYLSDGNCVPCDLKAIPRKLHQNFYGSYVNELVRKGRFLPPAILSSNDNKFPYINPFVCLFNPHYVHSIKPLRAEEDGAYSVIMRGSAVSKELDIAHEVRFPNISSSLENLVTESGWQKEHSMRLIYVKKVLSTTYKNVKLMPKSEPICIITDGGYFEITGDGIEFVEFSTLSDREELENKLRGNKDSYIPDQKIAKVPWFAATIANWVTNAFRGNGGDDWEDGLSNHPVTPPDVDPNLVPV